MVEENQVNLDALEQDVDTGVDNESNDSSTQDERYLSQKRRAEKAEAELKTLREAKATVQPKTEDKPTSGLTEDEILVISSVQDKEKLDKARKIAQLEGVSLSEALNTPLYKLFEQTIDAQRKAEKAQLNATSGSGKAKKDITLNTPGITPVQHKELWKSKNGL